MTSRRLTADEIKLAQSVFGDSLNYSSIRVNNWHFPIFQKKDVAMAPTGNLYMYNYYCDDFAKARDPYRRALFIHEMSHVWQYQNKILHPTLANAKLQLKHKFNYAAAYYYMLDAKKDLMKYGVEQQASIIEEYFLLKQGLNGRHCQNDCSPAERLKLYEKVLEKFHQNPSYAKRKWFFRPLGP
jgi:hypothetical protein